MALSPSGSVEVSGQTWRFLRYSWLWNRGAYRDGEYSEEIWVEGSYEATFILEPRIELYDLHPSEKRTVVAKYHLIFFDQEGAKIAQSRHYFTQQWSFPGAVKKKIEESFSIGTAGVAAANRIDSIAVEFFDSPFEDDPEE
jgi:hypothetical protein